MTPHDAPRRPTTPSDARERPRQNNNLLFLLIFFERYQRTEPKTPQKIRKTDVPGTCQGRVRDESRRRQTWEFGTDTKAAKRSIPEPAGPGARDRPNAVETRDLYCILQCKSQADTPTAAVASVPRSRHPARFGRLTTASLANCSANRLLLLGRRYAARLALRLGLGQESEARLAPGEINSHIQQSIGTSAWAGKFHDRDDAVGLPGHQRHRPSRDVVRGDIDA